MRITGNRLIDLASASTTKNQETVGTVSGQLSSGLRVTTPSDDPSAWLAAQRTKLRQALSQGTGNAVQASRDRLQSTDNALGTIGDIVSQVRELATQASSDSYNAADRAGIGLQVGQLFQSALDSANAKGNDGEFLLAGSNSLTAPFNAAGAYGGNATVRSVPSDGSVTTGVTVAGSELTAARGVDVLPLLSRIATALQTNDLTTLRAALPDLETATRQISSARTQGGAAVNVLDRATTARASLEQDMTAAISRFVEVDSLSAASELAKATQSLEVSKAVASHIIAMLAPST